MIEPHHVLRMIGLLLDLLIELTSCQLPARFIYTLFNRYETTNDDF